MATALQNTAISWDLESTVSYQANQELEFTLNFTAPEEGTYYVIGALYTSSLDYISGTLFGVLVPEGSAYGVNSIQYTSLWELEADESKELPSKFTFDRSNVVLGLFLMKMAGDEPSLEDDEQVGSLTTTLSGPQVVDVGQIMNLAIVVIMVGMMMTVALKE